MQWLEVTGSIASILALIVTLLVWLRVRAIQRRFILKARLPQLIESLQGNANNLSRYLERFTKSRREINTELSACESTLRNLLPKLSGDARSEARQLTHFIRTHGVPWWKRMNPNRHSAKLRVDTAWKMYDKLQALIGKLEHVSRDVQWSR